MQRILTSFQLLTDFFHFFVPALSAPYFWLLVIFSVGVTVSLWILQEWNFPFLWNEIKTHNKLMLYCFSKPTLVFLHTVLTHCTDNFINIDINFADFSCVLRWGAWCETRSCKGRLHKGKHWLLLQAFISAREWVFATCYTSEAALLALWIENVQGLLGDWRSTDERCLSLFGGAHRWAGLPPGTFSFFALPPFYRYNGARCEGGLNTISDLIIYHYTSFKIGRVLIKKEAYIPLFL